MKKIVLIITVFAFVSTLNVACKSDSKKMAKVEYACPMECEGDKSYTEKDTKCPVCKMDLKEKKGGIKAKKDVSVKQNHDNH